MHRASPTMIKPGAVLGQVGQEDPRQREHQGGADDPVQHQGRRQHPSVAGHAVDLAVAHLGEHRVHHQQQTQGDRQRDATDRHRLQRVVDSGREASEHQAPGHGQADPQRQEAVERGEPLDDVGVDVRRPGRVGHGVGATRGREDAPQRVELFRHRAVVHPGAVLAAGDQTRLAQHLEVVAHGGLALADRRREVTGARLTRGRGGDDAEQAQAHGVGQCLEGLGQAFGGRVVQGVGAERRAARGVELQDGEGGRGAS